MRVCQECRYHWRGYCRCLPPGHWGVDTASLGYGTPTPDYPNADPMQPACLMFLPRPAEPKKTDEL